MVSNRKVAKTLIDETTGQLLDNLHRLAKGLAGGHKKEADKVIKNIIKTVVKIGVLYRNDQFNHDELLLAERFRRKFHSLAMTVISFYEVDFSYDRLFVSQAMEECAALLKQLVARHLTDKSLSRIDHVFAFFGRAERLDEVFRRDGALWEILGRIVKDMHKLMEEGGL